MSSYWSRAGPRRPAACSARTAGPAWWWPASPAPTRSHPSASPTSANHSPARHDGVTVRIGGFGNAFDQVNAQTKDDLAMAEAITIPITVVALIWVFGSLLASLLPLLVGLTSIVGTMAILRGLAIAHRRLDLLAEHDHRDGPGPGDRLQPVHRQPLPRGDPRRPRARRRGAAHDADGRAHRAVLGPDRRALARRADGVPGLLPALVRLRRNRGGRAGHRRRARAAAGHAHRARARGRLARPARGRAARAAPARHRWSRRVEAGLLVPLRASRHEARAAGRPVRHRRAGRRSACRSCTRTSATPTTACCRTRPRPTRSATTCAPSSRPTPARR